MFNTGNAKARASSNINLLFLGGRSAGRIERCKWSSDQNPPASFSSHRYLKHVQLQLLLTCFDYDKKVQHAIGDKSRISPSFMNCHFWGKHSLIGVESSLSLEKWSLLGDKLSLLGINYHSCTYTMSNPPTILDSPFCQSKDNETPLGYSKCIKKSYLLDHLRIVNESADWSLNIVTRVSGVRGTMDHPALRERQPLICDIHAVSSFSVSNRTTLL